MKHTFWLLIMTVLQLVAGCSTTQTDLNDADAYLNRGIVYQRKGQYDQAISDYNKALEINPRYALAYYNRAERVSLRRAAEQPGCHAADADAGRDQENPPTA